GPEGRQNAKVAKTERGGRSWGQASQLQRSRIWVAVVRIGGSGTSAFRGSDRHSLADLGARPANPDPAQNAKHSWQHRAASTTTFATSPGQGRIRAPRFGWVRNGGAGASAVESVGGS